MKITLTGSLGNISKPLAETLVGAGHTVTIISSKADKKTAIESLGATAAIGSVDDVMFLTEAFKGADVVYTMVPPDFGQTDYRKYISRIGENYASAIKAAGVKRVVNLSSIGAHLESGTGPIAGLHDVENIFNRLEGVEVRQLRAGFFYLNFYGNIGMIKNMNILGSNYGGEDIVAMAHPKDIAAAAAEEIEQSFTGKTIRYVISDVRKSREIAATLGAAVGKAELPWVEFTDEQSYEGMQQAGLPEPIAKMYTEMGSAVRGGKLFEHFLQNKPATLGKTKLEEFAKEFALNY